MMYSKRSRYSRSPSPYRRYDKSGSRSVSRSWSISRSQSRSREASVENPGNNLYVTGLSARVTKRDLEKHFSNEGMVEDIHLVVDPRTRESRGFGFISMSTVEEADRCVQNLDRSVLEGRVITVEKARRRRGRTPTPGRYLGLRTVRVRRRSPSYSPYYRSLSPRDSSERGRSRSDSPYYGRRGSHSRGSYSPRYRRGRSYSRSRSPYTRSPVSRRDRSYSPYNSRRYYSPDDYYYRRSRYRAVSRSISPSVRRRSRRSYSRSISPGPRRSLRRNYSPSVSLRRSRRSYSRSISPVYRRSSRRSYSRSLSPRPRRSSRGTYRGSFRRHEYDHGGYSLRSYSRSPSGRPYSRSVSRSVTPGSASPLP